MSKTPIKTLLVLAPHPEVMEKVREAAGPEHYRLIHRLNLQEAEPFLGPGRVDAVIVDVESSQVQGLWAVERLRKELPQCPIFVLTGPTPWEWEEEAYLHGVSHVLAKPLRPRLFKELLERSVAPEMKAVIRLPSPKRILTPEPQAADVFRGPVRTLQVLRDFSAILTHSLCAEAMLKQFLLLLREILGVNRAAIFLRATAVTGEEKTSAEGQRHFRSACAIGLPSGLLEHFQLSFESGLGGYLYRHGRILRRDSDEAAEDFEIQKEFELLGAQVAIPILDRETLVGIAAFDGRLTGGPLGNTELELIFHLLEQLGLAVRNIWLHDQLSANHEMMADILRHLSSACVVVSRDLTILHFNKTARQYFGKSGRLDLEFSDLPQALGSKVYQVLKNGTGITPFKHTPADEPGTVYRVTIVPFQRLDSHVPNSALLVVEDHTQTEQLQHLEIETANLRLVKTMADRLAHEVGNAMVPLSTHQQLLAERYKDPEFRASLNVAMADSVKRVDRLINQMRFLARDSVLSSESLALAPLIEDAFREAQRHSTVKSSKLMMESVPQAVLVTGDRAALKHAFAEVLLNALQANPSDARITVRVQSGVKPSGNGKTPGNGNGHNPGTSDASEGELQIDIEDNGAGFSPEALKKVPEPFFTTRNVGLGLGMTVSRKIIETHHGHLSVVSPTTGQAATVRISLPAQSQGQGNVLRFQPTPA